MHNPNYEYLFFDDVDVDRFVQSHYVEYWDTFQRLTPRIKQIDLFRYLAVLHHGGFYLDMDMEVTASLESIRNNGVGAAAVFPIQFRRLSGTMWLTARGRGSNQSEPASHDSERARL